MSCLLTMVMTMATIMRDSLKELMVLSLHSLSTMIIQILSEAVVRLDSTRMLKSRDSISHQWVEASLEEEELALWNALEDVM